MEVHIIQKMAVPVMAIGVNLSAIDPQEEAWATAVYYWNEQVDEIDNLPPRRELFLTGRPSIR